MDKEKDTWTRFQEVRHIPEKYFTYNIVPFHFIDPNRFSNKRLEKILEKPRRFKAIFNMVIISFILIFIAVISVFVLAFLGSLVDDSIVFVISACAGIGLGVLKEELVYRFPINKHDSNMIIKVKGIRYNSYNEKLKSK